MSTISGMKDHEEALPDYTIMSQLGSGHTGIVLLCEHVKDGHKVAVKVVHRKEGSKSFAKNLRREIAFLTLLCHPNVIRLYEVRNRPNGVYLIMEYFDGKELFFYISKKPLSETKFRPLFRQIVDALDYTHRHNVSHRDLKPENILVNKDLSVIKLIDFGYSNSFCDDSSVSMMTRCGSPHYLPPEIILAEKYGPKVDVWSLGCLLYVSLLSRFPFDGRNMEGIYDAVLTKEPNFPEGKLSSSCVNLLEKMLKKKPEERCTLEDVRTHPWVSEKFHSAPARHQRPSMKDIHAAGIDETVVDEMVAMGFHMEETLNALELSKFDMHQNIYHLILEKRAREERERQERAEKGDKAKRTLSRMKSGESTCSGSSSISDIDAHHHTTVANSAPTETGSSCSSSVSASPVSSPATSTRLKHHRHDPHVLHAHRNPFRKLLDALHITDDKDSK